MNEEIKKLLDALAAGEGVYEGPKVGPTPNQIDLAQGFTLEQSSTISVPYMDEDGEWTKRSLPLVIADLQGKDELNMLRLIYKGQLDDQKTILNAHVVTPTGENGNGEFEVGVITGAQDLGAFPESMKIQDVRESAPSENGTYTLQNSPIKGEAVVYVNNLAVPSVEFSATDGVDGNVTFTFSKDQPQEDAEIAAYGNSIEATGAFKKHIQGCDAASKKISSDKEEAGDKFDGYEKSQKEELDKIKQELSDNDQKLSDAKQKLAESEELFDSANNENAIAGYFNDVRQNVENVYSIIAEKTQLEADDVAITKALDSGSAIYGKYVDASNEAIETIEEAKKESQERLDALEQWINGDDEGAK